MDWLDSIIEFKGNIPSVCGIRIGESYYDYHGLIEDVQRRCTGDWTIDSVLDNHMVILDVYSDVLIEKIVLILNDGDPFESDAFCEVTNYFRRKFQYGKSTETLAYPKSDDGDEFNFHCEISDSRFIINIRQASDDLYYGCRRILEGQILIEISTPHKQGSIEFRQIMGSNIVYYHEPYGYYAVKGKALPLSLVDHEGMLTVSDVRANLVKAIHRDIDTGVDWYKAYLSHFCQQEIQQIDLDNPHLVEEEAFIQARVEIMTNVSDYYGKGAERILKQAGVGKELVPIEAYLEDELLNGEIYDVELYLEQMHAEWGLSCLFNNYISMIEQKYYRSETGSKYLTISKEPGTVTEKLIIDNIYRMIVLGYEQEDIDLPDWVELRNMASRLYYENPDRMNELANHGSELVLIEGWSEEDLNDELALMPIDEFMKYEFPSVEWD